jgi:DNA processing protein
MIQPDPGDLELIVAASLLRLGGDTRAARLFKERGLTPRNALTGLADALGLEGPARADQMARAGARARAATAEAACQRLTIVSGLDGRYPALLSAIPDPPLVLWVSGDASWLDKPAIAVVGSRHGSASGLAMARQLGRELAEAGLMVVSGMARGIDGAAHRGALEAGGATVAVLGNGLDVTYPPEHAALAKDIASRGALVSEFPPGTPPLAAHFPLRNRIISGLCRAVVVVEASERSGSLITARAALEQGRDVLAVPGNVASGRYRGGHALIKDGARLVETVGDILEEIAWPAPGARPPDSDWKSRDRNDLLSLIRPGSVLDLDALAAETGRSAGDLLAELGTLEIAGRIRRLPGGGFCQT